MKEKELLDAIIVGGSYAGLSAAMALGRSLRNVLIIDNGQPCNIQTPASHNFLTHDGDQPAVISDKARSEVLRYPTVKIIMGTAVSATKDDKLFSVDTSNNERFFTRKLIIAAGIKDQMPAIKGFAECWGTTVVHCPYCHGFEFRAKRTGIMANGERAMHLTSLVHNLTKDITLFTSGKADFSDEQVARLRRHGLTVIEEKIVEVTHTRGVLSAVVLADGRSIELDALYASLPFTQHSAIPVSLGCELTEAGHVRVDQMQKTTVDGVFACGDSSSMMRSVALSVSTGNIAGAVVNGILSGEEF